MCRGPWRGCWSATMVGHDVKRAADMGWSELKNGVLLHAAEEHGFEVLLSCDKTTVYEQNMTGRKIAVISMSDNHWGIVRDYVVEIAQAIDHATPGTVTAVACGVFVPRRFREKPQL